MPGATIRSPSGARPALAEGRRICGDATAAPRRCGIACCSTWCSTISASDGIRPTLSLRGLDNALYYRHAPDGSLVNDAGCGNILACDEPIVVDLVLDSSRASRRRRRFRFDLATTLGAARDSIRSAAAEGHRRDPVLGRLELIAEPWDIGPGGYQVGRFLGC